MSVLSLVLLSWLLQEQPQTVTVQLRMADGSPAVGIALRLLDFGEATALDSECVTDERGACVWNRPKGLYELLSDVPLDNLSRYAVAEGGLRGFGLTVGDESITYVLTVQLDGFIYFDTEPDFATPVPFVPNLLNTHFHGTPTVEERESAENPTLSLPAAEAANTSESPIRLLIFIIVGASVGAGAVLLPKLRQRNGGSDA